MKIFQIGLNRCESSEYINEFCIDLGLKCIRWDHGNLMKTMMENFCNDVPLLSKNYDSYDLFGDIENMEHGMTCDLRFVERLDKQYPGSKFVMNTMKSFDLYIRQRTANDRSYMRLAMAMTKTSSIQEMVTVSKHLWNVHKESVKKYFEGRPNQLLEFDYEDHPMYLYLFLNPIDHVYNHFEFLYKTQFHRRIQHPLTLDNNEKNEMEDFCEVYCPFLPQREKYIRNILKIFPGTRYVEAITQDDLRKKNYRKLSTTLVGGQIISYCELCNYCSEHQDIFHKFTKLCIHLSYMVCIRHAVEYCQKEVVLIFEDDVFFDCTENEFYEHVQDFRNSEYDVCYLGFCACKHGDELVEKHDPEVRLISLPPNQTIRCKHAIIYKTSYLNKLIGELLPLPHNSDIQLNHANIQLNAKVAMVRRPIVFQDRERLGSFNENNVGLGEGLNLY